MLGLTAQPQAHLDAAGCGHHHVEADEIGGVLRDRPQRRVTVGRLDDVVTLALHELAEQRPLAGSSSTARIRGRSRLTGAGPDGVGERREVDRLAEVLVEPGRDRPIPIADHGVGGEGDDAQAGDRASSARSSLSACQPSMSGSPRSMSTRSGSAFRASAMPSAAVSAESTSWPAACSSLVASARFAGVSSTQDRRHYG